MFIDASTASNILMKLNFVSFGKDRLEISSFGTKVQVKKASRTFFLIELVISAQFFVDVIVFV
jgi:hypothetical protein